MNFTDSHKKVGENFFFGKKNQIMNRKRHAFISWKEKKKKRTIKIR